MNDDNKKYEEIEIPYTFKLRYPITIGSKENPKVYEEMIFDRRPRAEDFKGLNVSNMKADDSIRLLSRLCCVPVVAIEKLDSYDFVKLQEVVASFLDVSG